MATNKPIEQRFFVILYDETGREEVVQVRSYQHGRVLLYAHRACQEAVARRVAAGLPAYEYA